MKTLLLSCALALSCAPLHAASSTSTFVSVLSDSPLTFDPAAMYDNYSFSATLNIYEPLLTFGTDLKTDTLAPAIAEKVPTLENGLVSKDRLTYTFPIRKGVKFHDGTPLTPEDVRYSLMRFMLYDRDGGPSSILLKAALGHTSTRDGKGKFTVTFKDAADAVRVEGDNVVLTLKAPNHPILAILASWPMVVSKQWCVAHGEWSGRESDWKSFNNRPWEKSYLKDHANGTGPFKLASVNELAGAVKLVRNDNYWQAPAKLEKVIFIAVESEQTRQTILEDGDADYAELSRASLKEMRSVPGVEVMDDMVGAATGGFLFFTMNVEGKNNRLLGSGKLDGKGAPRDMFADPDVRKGFAYAIDYERYLKTGLRGKGTRATGPIPFSALVSDFASLAEGKGLDKEIEHLRSIASGLAATVYNRDMDKAREHFKKALGGKLWEAGFTVELPYNSRVPEDFVLAAITAMSLAEINPKFHVVPKAMQNVEFEKAMLEHRIPVGIAAFEPDYMSGDSFAMSLLHSNGLMARAQNFSDPETDKAIDTAIRASSEEEALNAYKTIQKRYDELVPQIYTYYPAYFRVVRKGVKGVKTPKWLDPFASYNHFNFYYVSKE